jgi:hypothetical protein
MKTGTGENRFFSQILVTFVYWCCVALSPSQTEAHHPSFDVRRSAFDVRCFTFTRRKCLVLVVFAGFRRFLQAKNIKLNPWEIPTDFRLISTKCG